MKVLFSALAKQELDDAVHYLELEFEGLGDIFKSEVKLAAVRIARHPKAWSVERGEVRKCLSLTNYCIRSNPITSSLSRSLTNIGNRITGSIGVRNSRRLHFVDDCGGGWIDKEPRSGERPSEHTPVVADFQV